MKLSILIASVLTSALIFSSAIYAAAHQTQDQMHQQISSSHMLTKQEQNEYKERIRTANSVEEKKQIRNEYTKLIQSRAKEQSSKSPDKFPKRMDGGFGSGHGGSGGKGR